jgi:hypothetical protein
MELADAHSAIRDLFADGAPLRRVTETGGEAA